MEPANSIISLFGENETESVAAVTQVCSVHRQSVYRWRWSKARGGTDGLIPQRYHMALLDAARERGIPLKAEHFLPGQKPDISGVAA